MARRPRPVPEGFTAVPPTPGEYRPTDFHMRIKARLLVSLRSTLSDAQSLTTAQIRLLVPNHMADEVEARWSDPGFKEYLLDEGDAAARLEYLYAKALDACEEMLSNSDPMASNARVQAVKLIAELGKKIQPRNAKDTDEGSIAKLIAGMDQTKLQAFISDGTQKLGIAYSKGEPMLASKGVASLPETGHTGGAKKENHHGQDFEEAEETTDTGTTP
jgi:hypothetical protein